MRKCRCSICRISSAAFTLTRSTAGPTGMRCCGPRRWAPDRARPRLLAVMSLDENKDPLLLLRAFARLRQTVPGATLTLVGTGPLAREVRQTIDALELGQAVLLPGHCSRLEVARL